MHICSRLDTGGLLSTKQGFCSCQAPLRIQRELAIQHHSTVPTKGEDRHGTKDVDAYHLDCNASAAVRRLSGHSVSRPLSSLKPSSVRRPRPPSSWKLGAGNFSRRWLISSGLNVSCTENTDQGHQSCQFHKRPVQGPCMQIKSNT